MKSFPQPLTAAEEKYYMQKYTEGDLEAKHILIERNLRLVAHIVKKYQPPPEEMEDLLSIGTIGLMKAVVTFDPDKSARLASYAARCIEKPQWMAAGLILAAVFNIAEAINLRSVLNSFGYQVSFRQGMKYAYTGYFFSSITPSATGGQPVQLYVMNKDNIHVAHGTMALLTELTSFQIAAFLMENVATFWILTGRIRLNKMMLALAVLGYLMNLIFIAALVVIMLSEGLKKKIVNGIRFLIMKLPFGNKKRLGAKMDEIVRDFEDCKLFFKRDPVLALKVTTVSLIQIICWFSVPWAVYHAMGEFGSSYGSMFLHQIILYMTTALLPFPGAEGISEFSFVKLFAGIFTSVPVAAAVLVNRGISFYFLLILSGIFSIVLGRMDRKSKSKMKVKLEKY